MFWREERSGHTARVSMALALPGANTLHFPGVDTHPVDTLAAVFTAVGTVAVAIVAVWGDWIRSTLAGPKLTLRLRDAIGDLTNTTDGGRRLYHHLIVENRRHWSPASAVRLEVTGVARRRPDGSFFPEPLLLPLQLMWAFQAFHELLPTIAERATCDLGWVEEGSGRFRLSTFFTPNNFNGSVSAGESVRVTLRASAHNGQSTPLVVEISWDGQWSANLTDMQRHLVVKEVSEHSQS